MPWWPRRHARCAFGNRHRVLLRRSQRRQERLTMSAARRDRGSATLWGVAFMGLVMAVALSVATVGAARVARHRVNDAADLSALAAARLVIVDPEGACGRAAAVALDNGVELVECAIFDEVVDVRTSLAITLPVVGSRTLTGRARAGPGRADSGAPSGGQGAGQGAGQIRESPTEATRLVQVKSCGETTKHQVTQVQVKGVTVQAECVGSGPTC
ncbi:Rv3654c family TadE-like protein [Nonomuraea cavernae]|uniref:Rv3654c family TadE-like protein n=1 Tax=Nonomuraea cavernae TaxID=2045107 RepID=UPI0033BFD98C